MRIIKMHIFGHDIMSSIITIHAVDKLFCIKCKKIEKNDTCFWAPLIILLFNFNNRLQKLSASAGFAAVTCYIQYGEWCHSIFSLRGRGHSRRHTFSINNQIAPYFHQVSEDGMPMTGMQPTQESRAVTQEWQQPLWMLLITPVQFLLSYVKMSAIYKSIKSPLKVSSIYWGILE